MVYNRIFEMNCRFCNSELKNIFLDLGQSPLANSYLTHKQLNVPELFYPLCAYVCSRCFLVQLAKYENPTKIFQKYAYFSSFSRTWLDHVKEFVDNIVAEYKLTKINQVIEIASNDGYLLKNFQKYQIPVLGIEPAKNISKIAKKNGIPTISEFFGQKIAMKLIKKGIKADVLIAFNVLPHVPELNDFVKGLKRLLSRNGILIIQFSAYLPSVIKNKEFDQIYHEHFSYFSLFTINKILLKYELEIFDVHEYNVHGGSLRLFIKHKTNKQISIRDTVVLKISEELHFGINKLSTYVQFQKEIEQKKLEIWKLFASVGLNNKQIIAYGAPAKGNTMLNYVGFNKRIINYTVDTNPHKQGHFLPGTHIPIYNPLKIKKTKPDFILVLPWNLKDEIVKNLEYVKKWNCKLLVLTPKIMTIK